MSLKSCSLNAVGEIFDVRTIVGKIQRVSLGETIENGSAYKAEHELT